MKFRKKLLVYHELKFQEEKIVIKEENDVKKKKCVPKLSFFFGNHFQAFLSDTGK